MQANESLETGLGQYGSTYINDTALNSISGDEKKWSLIHCLDATVFDTLTDAKRDGDTFTGETIPAGAVIGGIFTAIKLASGRVIAYRGAN